ncbi:hypothetical protein FQN57_005039 [Myotisia sp. PD_48]|nr:hypothetical protein FQN57_005039 [Myotisia sp. PD_48]
MSNNPSQLFLLADHIKLSLLERQRAISLELEPNSQDGEISRSLESLHDGLAAAEKEAKRLKQSHDPAANDLIEQAAALRIQYTDLYNQFHSTNASPNLTNDPLTNDGDTVIRASSTPSILKHPTPQHPISKSVRFTDELTMPDPEDDDPNRTALLGRYHDSPSSQSVDSLSNQGIHDHHIQIMAEQDLHLDQLGESISRQQQLSMQIGDELDGQVALLDDVDAHVDRHTSRLDGARRRLGNFSRKSKGSTGFMTIIGLIIVLVILIVILK